MTRRDPLDPLLDDVRRDVHAQIAAGGRVRDFAAMIARARAIDPSAVSPEHLAEVADYAPVVTLRRPPSQPARPTPPPRASRARLVWLSAAIAAAALLALVGPDLAREVLTPRTGDAVPYVGPLAPHHEAREAREATPSRPARSTPRTITPDLAPAESIAPDLAPPESAAPTPPEPTPATQPPRRTPPLTSPAIDLDRRAREAWERGDLAAARRLFATFVATEQDPRRVELAYGDLLLLARHSGDDRGLAQARRAYLARFPRGHYADDASAGLCRGTSGAATCWRHYLIDWPTGAHVDEARRVIDASERRAP